jgi:transcriptional regulator GlxA family with amidase domain
MGRRIIFLGFPGVQALDIVGSHQMFVGADEAMAGAYTVLIAAPKAGPVAASSGLNLGADLDLADLNARFWRPTDTCVAVGGEDVAMRRALAAGAIASAIRAAAGVGARLASVCSGAFFLAQVGALDGKRAATHWRAAADLARLHPAITVDADALYVEDGGVWTSAGVTAGIDLALAMIEADCGRAVALSVARRHVVFRKRPGGQSQFAEPDAGAALADPRLAKLARAIAAAPAADWSTSAMAAAAGMSLRSLTRAFARESEESPARFVERLRVERARVALLESARSIAEIAAECGFGAARGLERAFARHLGVAPIGFRERFGARRS